MLDEAKNSYRASQSSFTLEPSTILGKDAQVIDVLVDDIVDEEEDVGDGLKRRRRNLTVSKNQKQDEPSFPSIYVNLAL